MTRSILISLAILTLSTSVALARTHHSRAMTPNASAAATTSNAFGGAGPSPAVWQGGVSSSDRDMYFRNLHDSGYNPKNNRNSFGNVATQ
jgi:hypothetical protein